MRKAQPVMERFMRFVEPVTESGCWLWTGGTHQRGYGLFKVGSRTDGTVNTVRAHRFSYEQHIGQIPEGMIVCHKCDVPGCVNPTHLFLGTHTDNNRDRERKGRGNPVKGLSHYRATVPASVIRAVKAASGTQSQIARRFHVSQAFVHRVRAGIRHAEI